MTKLSNSIKVAALFLAVFARANATECICTEQAPASEINVKNERGCTKLHVAVWNCNVAEVKALLEAGADTTIVNAAGKTALEFAIILQADTKTEEARDAYATIIQLLSPIVEEAIEEVEVPAIEEEAAE